MPERTTTSTELPHILELMALGLGEGSIPRTEAFWNWKHEDNPHGRSPVLVAEERGTLTGLRAFMRWTWRSGTLVVPAVRAVDTVTHPEWRGQGLFKRLTRSLLDVVDQRGAAFVFNTPNEKSRPGYLKMGWVDVARPAVWMRPMNPLGMARPRTDVNADTGAARDGSIAELLEQPELPALLDAIEAGFARRGDRRLHTHRTPGYLAWRYRDIPGFAYGARWLFRGGSGAAVVFRQRARGGRRELTLAEVLVTPSARGAALGTLLLSRMAAGIRADYAAALAPARSHTAAALGMAGFLPVPNLGPHFTVRKLRGSRHLALDPADWRSWWCSLGDLELF